MINQLRTHFGERILTEAVDLEPYAFDGTAELNQRPLAVLMAASEDDVRKLCEFSKEHGFSIVARGNGTGLSGGSVPGSQSVVLCLSRMNRILELDRENLTLTTEAGTITQQIAEAAQAEGLLYAPDPSSQKISTIGGNVANNSGGLRGLKYGVTRDYVMGMRVILADGSVCELGNKCVKDVAGYSLRDLFIGSEGTLGIITQVTLKLLPQPAVKQTLLATFDSMERAAETVSRIIAAKITPCTLEFIDRPTLRSVEDFANIGLPTEAEALLLMESDGHPAAVEEEAQAMEQIARECGAVTLKRAESEEEAAGLAKARRSAFSALARIRPTTILEDVTVPRSKLAEMVAFVNEVAERYRLQVGTFGHFGDGNLHPTFLTDERDAEEMKRVHAALEAIFQKTVELGGTITGEHGVGLAKKPYLPLQFGQSERALMKLVKQALDPDGRLNPGKIF